MCINHTLFFDDGNRGWSCGGANEKVHLRALRRESLADQTPALRAAPLTTSSSSASGATDVGRPLRIYGPGVGNGERNTSSSITGFSGTTNGERKVSGIPGAGDAVAPCVPL